MLMLGTHEVSYVIGQIVVNLNMSTFNKHISNLKVKYLEMPNAIYTRPLATIKKTDRKLNYK